jgi:hypothetical protein
MTKGTLAELHDYLVRKGYSYHKTKQFKDKKKLVYKKGNAQVEIVRIAKGRPAASVNIPISRNMTQTRTHGTPDTYKARRRKK